MYIRSSCWLYDLISVCKFKVSFALKVINLSMNYLHHPNLLVQFWAAVNTEFDKILDSFVRSDGWLFQDLGMAAKEANIVDIFRCVCTLSNDHQGKIERLDHFVRVNFVILDAAKTQWLVPWRNYVVDPSKGVIPPFLKRQVGGFFLLYMIYTNQPLPNRFHKKQRIFMDSRDLIAMHAFNATMQRLPKADDQLRELARQLVIMFNDLVTSEAFEFNAFSDTFTTPCHSIRQLLASKLCIFTKMVYTLKDLRDQLHYITYQENSKVFKSLVKFGRFLPQKSPQKNQKSKRNAAAGSDETAFCPADKKWSVEEIKALEDENDIGKLAHSVTCVLKSLDFGPIFTRTRITGVADNLLDKELNSCVKTYSAYQKLIDDSKQRYRERKYPNSTGPAAKVIFKKYYSGNYDWIDDIFSNEEHIPEPAPESVNVDTLNETFISDDRGATVEMDIDEEDEEWVTEDDGDSDYEEVEVDPATLVNQKVAQVNNKTARVATSPSKRNQRILSMPTIL